MARNKTVIIRIEKVKYKVLDFLMMGYYYDIKAGKEEEELIGFRTKFTDPDSVPFRNYFPYEVKKGRLVVVRVQVGSNLDYSFAEIPIVEIVEIYKRVRNKKTGKKRWKLIPISPAKSKNRQEPVR